MIRRRLLVLGATGKLGRMVADPALGTDEYPVEIIPVSRTTCNLPGAVRWDGTGDFPADSPVDAVVAMWGVTGENNPDLDKNTTLGLAANRLARKLRAPLVVHCSSVAVYEPRDAPLSEADPCRPPGAYGRAKRDMEIAVHQSAAPRSLCLRIGSVAGAESLFANGRGTGHVTLHRFRDGQGPLRSYIAPSDLARVVHGLCHVAPDRLPPVLNVAAPAPVGMADLAHAMGWRVSWIDAPEGARQSAVMDTSRLGELVPLGPAASDPDGIARDVKSWWDRA